MNYRSLRKTTCCIATALTLTAMPMTALAAPLAGATGATSVSLTGESSPHSGISRVLTQYLTDTTAEESVEVAEVAAATASSPDVVAPVKEKVSEKEAEKQADEVLVVAQVNGWVNVRAHANEESEILGKLYDESVGTVIKETDGWYKIQSGSVTGYVKAEYVKVGTDELLKEVGTRIATVNTQTLRVREKADGDSKIIELVPDGEDLVVVSEKKKNDGWIKVTVEGGEGYVSVDYVVLSTEYTYAESKAEEERRLAKEEAARKAAEEAAAAAIAAQQQAEAQQAASSSASSSSTGSSSSSSSSSSRSSSSSSASSSSSSSSRSYSSPSGSSGQAVANYACQFVGNPYVYGGSSLTNGADCSGFVMAVYAAFGVSLPHSSSALRSVGYGVSMSEIRPGDIVCYSGHVGIYAGNNTLVHASSPETGIKYTSPITYRQVLAVRRIF